MNSEYKTRLFNGLPAVFCGDHWVIISPYAGELVRLSQEQIDDPETKSQLDEKGFFGKPSERGPGALSDYFQLTLITNSDCNLRCRYCFANAGENRIVMDEKVAFAAVRYGIERAAGRDLLISFFGGEPSLTPSLIKKVVAYARQSIIGTDVKRVRFNITTNGVMSLSFLNFLINNDFFLTISMDGVPVVQDYQRPLRKSIGGSTASSPILERTIRALVSRNHGFMIRATITDYSVKYLVPTIEYLHGLGVTQFHCEVINLAGRAIMETKGQPMKRPSPEAFVKNLKATIIRAGELGMGVLNSSYMNLMQPSVHFCDGVGGNRVSVSYTGEVTTCLEVQGGCHPTADYFIVGRYNEGEDKISINPLKQLRICGNAITSQNCCCHECFAIYTCGGGCPIRNYHMTGDQNTVDPFRCKVIKSILPFVFDLFDRAIE
ncbi:MAG: SPASM domain-containing protein [Candidatus Omnitrophica bacterium]|nr:SPASM domain-containing protein [Candidatus Omnitrophota bacterium]